MFVTFHAVIFESQTLGV